MIVRAIGATKRSLPAPYKTRNSMPSGNQVFGQVTLDMCGADFRSEGLRVARHQVDFASKDHRSRVSTETVAYRAGGAALAMQEIRHARATCPKGFVGSHVAGTPLLKVRLASLPVRGGWEPGTIAMRITETDQAGKSGSGLVIYQRRGNILNGTYTWGRGRALVRAANLTASLMAREMNAAPAARTEA
jgi:hypothetical protein